MDDTNSVGKLVESCLAHKPEEKRNTWVQKLLNEEFETVDDLQNASDGAWDALSLPIAIKDILRRAVNDWSSTTTPSLPSTTTTPLPPAKAPPKGDTRPITQLDVVVFDISVSMNSKSMDPDNTRLGAAKILFHTMVDKLVGHECPHSLGLVLFGEKVRWIPFTRDYESFHDILGDAPADEYSTKLYDSIQTAAEELVAYRNGKNNNLSPDVKCRIFCLTDGEDNSSKSQPWKVAQFLQKNKIVLDCIPLATQGNILQKMSLATGGLSLKVVDMQKGASLFEREAVILLSSRDIVGILPQITSLSSLTTIVTESVEDVKTAVPQAVMQNKVMTADDVIAIQKKVSDTPPAGGNGSRRVLREYKEICEKPASGFQCFMTSDIFFWKVIMDGPVGTPHEGGRFMMYIKFPTNYPFGAPEVRFLTPIYHPNVNNDGKICLSCLISWVPITTLSTIFGTLMQLIVQPDPANALDTVKANLYSDNIDTYDEHARVHTKTNAMVSLDELKVQFNLN